MRHFPSPVLTLSSTRLAPVGLKRSPLMRDRAPKTIGLLDHMGYGNLGDAAIQESVIANIKKRMPNVQLVGFSSVPDDTVTRHGIPCHSIRRGREKTHAAGGMSRTSSLKA